ncbi:CDP-diacylglycerol--glycerol-3-phosphate 3-phosphatidyltransferase [Nibricoccus sp. IMCC34717]|uniref:CDP-diacylglycerol--glycerol-3-phosphate 3-phosphatidyltransferase n=1 Tax=Nibricoccus sp. IMCC34717 TaxID=3034021 RepID=UPI00384DE3A1
MPLNLPNLITLSRIPAMFLIVALMYADFRWAASLAFWLFIASAIGDWLDGHLARKRGLVSIFGKFMDALTDKILVIGLMVAFVEQNQSRVFLVLVLVTLCREFIVSGMRMVAASRGIVVAAERGGKAKTVMQLVAVGFLLFVPMLEKDFAPFLPFAVAEHAKFLHQAGMVIFVLGTVLTLSSGWSYVSKYRAVFEDPPKA